MPKERTIKLETVRKKILPALKAGQHLSNAAFNLKHLPVLPKDTRKLLTERQDAWDVVAVRLSKWLWSVLLLAIAANCCAQESAIFNRNYRFQQRDGTTGALKHDFRQIIRTNLMTSVDCYWWDDGLHPTQEVYTAYSIRTNFRTGFWTTGTVYTASGQSNGCAVNWWPRDIVEGGNVGIKTFSDTAGDNYLLFETVQFILYWETTPEIGSPCLTGEDTSHRVFFYYDRAAPVTPWLVGCEGVVTRGATSTSAPGIPHQTIWNYIGSDYCIDCEDCRLSAWPEVTPAPRTPSIVAGRMVTLRWPVPMHAIIFRSDDLVTWAQIGEVNGTEFKDTQPPTNRGFYSLQLR